VVALVLALVAVARALVPGTPTSSPAAQSPVDGPVVVPSLTQSTTEPVPSPSRTTAVPRRTTPAPPQATPTQTSAPAVLDATGLTAQYSVQERWPGGFIARVAVSNGGSSAQTWQVRLEYPATVAGFVAGWSNGTVQPRTETGTRAATITGATPLGAGQTIAVFVQFGAMGGNITPTECDVNGVTCALS
jgi:cellulase/cellobiase CelA1